MEGIEVTSSERWRNSEGERHESDPCRMSLPFPGSSNEAPADALTEDIYSDDAQPTPSPARSDFNSASHGSDDARSVGNTFALDNGEEERYGSEQYDEDAGDEQEDLSLLKYARNHGLVKDYTSQDLFEAVDYPSPSITLADPDSVPTIDSILNKEEILKLHETEKLDIDKDTAHFLASILSLARNDEPLQGLAAVSTPFYLRDLKIEEPVLTSDPQLDLWRLRRRNAAIVSSTGMDLFELNSEKGEGLAWSMEEKRAHMNTEKVIAGEKLNIDIETLTYLRDEILVFSKAATDDDVASACVEDGAIRHPKLVSPPLLPISPPFSPMQPSNEAMNMALTSSPLDLTAQEASHIEQQILEQEEATSSDPNFNQALPFDTKADPRSLYSPLCTPQNSSSSPWRRTRVKDLEIDVPLVPEKPADTPQAKTKTVSFPSELHTMIPMSDADLRTSDHERDFDSFVKDVVTPLAESAIQEAQNERLSEADTTMRIRVSAIAEVELKAPWTRSKDGSILHGNLLSETRSSLAESNKKWSGVSKVERLLSWTPFPTRFGKVQTDETFDDGSLARYMAEISFEDNTDFEGLVWKPEGLRILDDAESDDEELECLEEDDQGGVSVANGDSSAHEDVSAHLHQDSTVASIPSGSNVDKSGQRAMDMQTLLRKRKLELEGGKDAVWPNKLPDRNTATDRNLTAATNTPSNAGITGGMSAFMRLHGDELKTGTSAPKSRGATLQQFAPPAVMVRPEANVRIENDPAPLPTPSILDAEARKAIILSSDLAKNRSLMRLILRSLPQLEVIEREAIITPITKPQSTTKQSNRYEADITLSAGTGAIVTTLQQLRQKPLPGQSNFFGVRDRIQSVAVRYEQVHVLVHEARLQIDGDPNTTNPLDQQDAESLSDLIGFATTLDTDVEVYFVAGSEAELAQWLAAFISHYGISEISLLQEETLWERFLRYAGLNAYASQTILSQLKRVESHQTEMSSSSMAGSALPHFGLAAFLQMSADERVERFGPLLGGDRVLRRVNEAIDSQWLSAAAKNR